MYIITYIIYKKTLQKPTNLPTNSFRKTLYLLKYMVYIQNMVMTGCRHIVDLYFMNIIYNSYI